MVKQKIDEIVVEIVMSRRQRRPISFLITEGITDRNFFAGVLRGIENKDYAVKDLSGKVFVRDLVSSCNSRDIRGVLGVVDRDWDQFFDRDYSQEVPNLYYMDQCDFETATVRMPSCFKRFCAEYFDCNERVLQLVGSTESAAISEFFQSLAGEIGFLQFLDEKYNWDMSFSEIQYESACCDSDFRVSLGHSVPQDGCVVGFDTIFDDRTFEIRSDKLVEFFHARSSNPSDTLANIKQIHTNALAEMADPSLSRYCRGHHVTLLIAAGLVYGGLATYPPHQLSHEAVERTLRGYMDIKQTNLYTEILHWQENNVPHRLL